MAEWHRFDGVSYRKVQTTFLLNPIAPVDIEFTNQGVSTALESDKELAIDDSIGGRFIVKLDTGAFEYLRQGGSCR